MTALGLSRVTVDDTTSGTPSRLGEPGGVRFAVLGSLVWVAWLVLDTPDAIAALIGLSPAVLHPMIVRLARLHASEGSRLERGLSWVQLPAAACLLVALGRPPGTLAAALALPWLLATLWTAALGIQRARAHRLRPLSELSIDAGLVMLAVGGAWVVASRAGMRPMGFSPIIVLLTAAHFHYAGFVLPVLAGLAVRMSGRRAYRLIPVGVLLGVPLTAVGITVSPLIEVVAAVLVASSGIGLAVAQLDLSRQIRTRMASMLLAVSALALLYGMTLAAIYAVGEYRGLPWPSIPEMASLHGTVNALGFGLLGTWGFTFAQRFEPEHEPDHEQEAS